MHTSHLPNVNFKDYISEHLTASYDWNPRTELAYKDIEISNGNIVYREDDVILLNLYNRGNRADYIQESIFLQGKYTKFSVLTSKHFNNLSRTWKDDSNQTVLKSNILSDSNIYMNIPNTEKYYSICKQIEFNNNTTIEDSIINASVPISIAKPDRKKNIKLNKERNLFINSAMFEAGISSEDDVCKNVLENIDIKHTPVIDTNRFNESYFNEDAYKILVMTLTYGLTNTTTFYHLSNELSKVDKRKHIYSEYTNFVSYVLNLIKAIYKSKYYNEYPTRFIH
jgi:hypothetical protein